MAGKININPEALKRNLDVIIVVVVAIGLIGYGWLQLGDTQTTRTGSAESLENETRDYNAIHIDPEPNKGVFFNSNLVHYVDINRSQKDRVSIAYNIGIHY